MRRMALTLAPLFVISVGCASGSPFHSGPRSPELVGTWVDSAASTPTDTVAWDLASNGDFRTLAIRSRTTPGDSLSGIIDGRHYAEWFVSGSMSDTSRREFCFKRRARNGGSCMHFEIDRMPDGRRRLRLSGYADRERTGQRVLTERTTR
jgi:hypothetical protein